MLARISIVLTFLLLASCGGYNNQAVKYHSTPSGNSSNNTTSSNGSAGSATLEFYRPSGFLYMMLSSIIKVDGREIVRLKRGNSYRVSVPEGTHEIRVEASMNPGASLITGYFKSGGVYSFEVAPNSSSFGTGGIQLGLISGSSSNSGLFGIKLLNANEPNVSQASTTATSAGDGSTMTISEAKKQCAEIGFTAESSDFGNCVLELTD